MDLAQTVRDFLTNNPWASIFILLIGVVGSVVSIISWRSSKRSEKAYKYLFQIAELNIDKSTTEEVLARKKKEVSEASEKIVSLQQQIRRDIPIVAKRAVLEDRLDSAMESLTRYYQDVQTIQRDLERLGTSPDIPQDILTSIRSEIQPNYIVRRQISNDKTWLTILTAAAALTSAFLYPISNIISPILLIATIPLVVRIAKINFVTNSEYTFREWLLRRFVPALVVIGTIITLIISGLFILLYFTTSGEVQNYYASIAPIALLVFLIALVILLFILIGRKNTLGIIQDIADVLTTNSKSANALPGVKVKNDKGKNQSG